MIYISAVKRQLHHTNTHNLNSSAMKTFSRDFIVRMQLRAILQSCDSLSFLSPILLIAAVNAIAIINMECCIIAFLVFPVMISTCYVWTAKSCAKWVVELLHILLSHSFAIFQHHNMNHAYQQNEILRGIRTRIGRISARLIWVFRSTARAITAGELYFHRTDFHIVVAVLQGEKIKSFRCGFDDT